MFRECVGLCLFTFLTTFAAAFAQPKPIASTGADVPPPWTAAMWVKRDSDHADTVLMGSAKTALKLEQWNNTHKVGFTLFGKGDHTFAYSVEPDGTWVHLTFVASATDIKLYVNGEYDSKIDVTGDFPRSATQTPTAESQGVQHFDTDLAEHQVADMYQNAPRPGEEPTTLLHCYSGNELSGNRVSDSVGGLHATTNGEFTSCRVSNGVLFAGEGKEMIIGGSDIPPPWSIAMWVGRRSDNADSVLLESADPNPGKRYALKLEQYGSDHEIGYTIFGTGDYKFGYSVPPRTWHHLVFVASTTDIKLYVDGQTATPYSIPVTGNLPMHRIAPTDGAVDEVKLYRGALNEQGIVDAYKNPCPVSGILTVEEDNGPSVLPGGTVAISNGDLDLFQKVTKTFVVKNAGLAPLDLNAMPSAVTVGASNFYASLLRGKLDPGKELKFTVGTTVEYPEEQKVLVTVKSNDPKHKEYSFFVTVKPKPWVGFRVFTGKGIKETPHHPIPENHPQTWQEVPLNGTVQLRLPNPPHETYVRIYCMDANGKRCNIQDNFGGSGRLGDLTRCFVANHHDDYGCCRDFTWIGWHEGICGGVANTGEHKMYMDLRSKSPGITPRKIYFSWSRY